MSFKLETINLFCDDIKVYRSFFSIVFEVDFEHDSSFYLKEAKFDIIELHGFKAPITSSFSVATNVSPEDMAARIELYNFKHPSHPSSLTRGNPSTLADPFSLNWSLEFSSHV